MKSLYIRIVATFIIIAMFSSLLALLLSNYYYVAKLREQNEEQIWTITNEIRTLYEQVPDLEPAAYFTHIANMGFQLYTVNGDMDGVFYGTPFKHTAMDPEQIRQVLNGQTYRGMLQERHFLMVTGFFENSIRNSIGVPIQVKGKPYALFVRPNLEQQIGGVRILMAFLLGLTFLFSILLIIIFSQYIVKPVKKLTTATQRIVGGHYEIKMDVTRQDEIGELARNFTFMAQSLQQLDNMRQEFVGNVSHEIQSPLTSIQGFTQSILDKETSEEEKERYLAIILEESKRMSSLSKQLLTLASLDKENHVVKRSVYRLDEQIRQILILTEWQWVEKSIAIELEMPEVTITADTQLLHQVWLNFITNAIKFSQTGDALRIEIQQLTGEIVVVIHDSGIGIPEAEIAHIFDRFYKADKARNRANAGSGLGLSIAQKIIQLHQGSVEVMSELGQGTTFTIHLPRL
ncbi:two-component sensor histidine kinase [Paenibacillus marchantiophytorum]|uniref:Heme sensor protein HssS n=1 Tax=Paenibacillus marchantiophytorum TaxID=1619310 RepID=A0ABQ1EMV2_9BACL|nr:HAMP domain-containing sensor histidine kinase [Paenibacillus marchantiophytorum]GFZ78296.1 two-component sensor histidine kinase [Paenibacillus marchantiophytorum]